MTETIDRYQDISQFEPLIPTNTGALEDKARELLEFSSAVSGALTPEFRETIREHLMIVNSYYSNLIEGHDTHPVEIYRAMRKEYSEDKKKRDLQTESLIHIDVQRQITKKTEDEPGLEVTSEEFLKWIHRAFYEQLPESMRVVEGDDGETDMVIPGEFRVRDVHVAYHIPPVPDSLKSFLERFNNAYRPADMHGLRPYIAIAAAHHRLMWIHPFLDGNGRVARLFTDAYFERLGLPGYGLWNVSRGLARSKDEYRNRLAAADSHRENDYDGRGNLSEKKLSEFCEFFLETCLDQARFMVGTLAISDLVKRIERYVELRKSGFILDEKGKARPELPTGTLAIIKEILWKGKIARGEVAGLIGMGDRKATYVIADLLKEGLLESESERGKLRLGISDHFAPYWFPNLYPDM